MYADALANFLNLLYSVDTVDGCLSLIPIIISLRIIRISNSNFILSMRARLFES